MFDLHEVGFQLCSFSNSEETETYSAKYIHTMQVVFLNRYLKKVRRYISTKRTLRRTLKIEQHEPHLKCLVNCRTWFIVENRLMYYLCHNIFIYWKSVLIDAVYISLWLLRCHLCHTEHYFSLTSTVPPVSYRTIFISDFYCATCVIQNDISLWLLLCHLCHTEQ